MQGSWKIESRPLIQDLLIYALICILCSKVRILSGGYYPQSVKEQESCE